MIEHNTTADVIATDVDGDRLLVENHGTEVWFTTQRRDGDYQQVRLTRADAQQFAASVTALVAS